ncbi:IS4 family transposase ISPen1 [compost metagenome]
MGKSQALVFRFSGWWGVTGDKVLVKTLSYASQTPKAALKALFKSRWHVELDLRNLKSTMGLERLSCKTPAMATKELWIYLLAHNLIRLIMAQSASMADCLPRELSFKHSLQLWLIWRQLEADASQPENLHGLLLLIAQQRVGNRAGRVEPRALKRRPKPYPLLTRTRQAARAEIRRSGHPRRVK